MPDHGRLRRALAATAFVGLIGVALVVVLSRRVEPTPTARIPLEPEPGPSELAASEAPPTDSEADARSDDAGGLRALPDTPWSKVDLDAIREVMPDNTFWTMAMPTRDPEIEAARAATRERWNREWGKVQSNTATAEEIDAYYAERQRVSQDYVEFATYLLAEYGTHLTERDVGLLKVAIELNLARLERFPREIALAHERREVHDAARRAWREQERLFEDSPTR